MPERSLTPLSIRRPGTLSWQQAGTDTAPVNRIQSMGRSIHPPWIAPTSSPTGVSVIIGMGAFLAFVRGRPVVGAVLLAIWAAVALLAGASAGPRR